MTGVGSAIFTCSPTAPIFLPAIGSFYPTESKQMKKINTGKYQGRAAGAPPVRFATTESA
jgi:hypothetical protein